MGERTVLVPVDLDALLEMQGHGAGHGPGNQPDESGELFPYANLLLEHWRNLLAWAFVGAVIASVLSYTFPPVFRGEVTFIPVESGSNSRFSSLLSQLGGLGLGTTEKRSPSGQLAVVLASRLLAEEMFTRFPELTDIVAPPSWLSRLMGPGDPPNIERLALGFKELVSIDIPRKDDQPMVLAVELPHATMSALVANAYMNALASYVNRTAFTNARKSREYIESQVTRYQGELTQAEENLRAFQEQHRIVSLAAQTGEAIRVTADLRGRLLVKQMEREVRLKTATPNHPEVTLIDDQIAVLRSQLKRLEEGTEQYLLQNPDEGVKFEPGPLAGSIASAPQLTLDYYRKRRDVEITAKVFDLLMNQLALARIAEQNESVTFQVIDRAVVPWNKVRPKRKQFAAVGGFLGALAGALLLIYRRRGDQLVTPPAATGTAASAA